MIDLLLGGTPEEIAVYLSSLVPELLSRISLLEEQSVAYAEIIRMLRSELSAQHMLDTDKWNDLVRSVSDGISRQIRGAGEDEASRIRKISNLIQEFSSDQEAPLTNLTSLELSSKAS
jgi:hypothetical protein